MVAMKWILPLPLPATGDELRRSGAVMDLEILDSGDENSGKVVLQGCIFTYLH